MKELITNEKANKAMDRYLCLADINDMSNGEYKVVIIRILVRLKKSIEGGGVRWWRSRRPCFNRSPKVS